MANKPQMLEGYRVLDLRSSSRDLPARDCWVRWAPK